MSSAMVWNEEHIEAMVADVIAELLEMKKMPRCDCERPRFKPSELRVGGHFYWCSLCDRRLTQWRVVAERLTPDVGEGGGRAE